MAIEINCNCDNCSTTFSNGEPSYCNRCYQDLENEIDKLKIKLDEVETEKDDLQNQVHQYEQDL